MSRIIFPCSETPRRPTLLLHPILLYCLKSLFGWDGTKISFVSHNAVQPEDPGNGPEPCFCPGNPTMIREKGKPGCTLHSCRIAGHQREKTNQYLRWHQNFFRLTRLEFSGLIHKRSSDDPCLAKNPILPSFKFVLNGLQDLSALQASWIKY